MKNIIVSLFILMLNISACTYTMEGPRTVATKKPTIEEYVLPYQLTNIVNTIEPQIILTKEPISAEITPPIIDNSKIILIAHIDLSREVFIVSLPCWDADLRCLQNFENVLLVDVDHISGLNISSSGEKALFISDAWNTYGMGALFVTTLGEDSYRLVSGVGHIGYAIWSPDETQIAFTSNQDSANSLHIVSEDGREDIILPTPYPYNTYPSWSPDATQIAFYSQNPTTNDSYLYTLDLETYQISQLSELEVSPTQLPKWSPNGKKIAYLIKNRGQEDICIVDIVSLDNRCFYTKDFWDTSPAWSPDNSTLIFSSEHEVHGSGVYIMPLETGKSQKISQQSGAYYSGPIWAPTGSYIACDVLIEGRWYAHLIAVDGSWEIQLSDGDYDIYAGQFLP